MRTPRRSHQATWRDDLPISMSPLRFFLFATRPHWYAALVATLIAALGNALSAGVSYIFKLIANAANAVTHGESYVALLLWCTVYIAVLGLAKLLWRVSGFA